MSSPTRLSGKVLQSAATTGNGTELTPAVCSLCQYFTFYITGSAGVSAGAVTIETAPYNGYTGTWAAEESAVTVTASTTKIVKVVGPREAMRARISTTVADGTVTVTVVAN